MLFFSKRVHVDLIKQILLWNHSPTNSNKAASRREGPPNSVSAQHYKPQPNCRAAQGRRYIPRYLRAARLKINWLGIRYTAPTHIKQRARHTPGREGWPRALFLRLANGCAVVRILSVDVGWCGHPGANFRAVLHARTRPLGRERSLHCGPKRPLSVESC